jgi:ribosomal protein L29
MKRNAKNEAVQQSAAELSKRIADMKQKIAQMGVNRYTKQTKNVREALNLRRSVAVLSTILRAKRITETEDKTV